MQIHCLHLGNNHIGDEGCVAVMAALSESRGGIAWLEQLGLGDNQIGSVGASAIASALVATGAPGLKDPNFERNRISTAGFRALTEALKKPAIAPNLKELYVTKNDNSKEPEATTKALKAAAKARGCRKVFT